MIKRECHECKRTYKTRRGLYYIKPEVIREKIDPNFYGIITDINKEELGYFLCLKDIKEINKKLPPRDRIVAL